MRLRLVSTLESRVKDRPRLRLVTWQGILIKEETQLLLAMGLVGIDKFLARLRLEMQPELMIKAQMRLQLVSALET